MSNGSPAETSAVIFDVDGTLVDTNYLHVRAWRRAFLDHGHDVSSWRIHRMIGAASGRLMRDLIGESDDDVKDAWRDRFRELEAEVRAFPAAADLLRTLSERGATVVLATSSPAELLDTHLAAIASEESVIAHVLDDSDVEEAKPAPDMFQLALDAAGVGPERAITVGDAVWDVQAAANAGLDTVAVASGGNSAADLSAAGAVAVYDDVAQLLDELDSSPIARLLDGPDRSAGHG